MELSESLKELKNETKRLKDELIDAQNQLCLIDMVKNARERCDDSSSVECKHGYAHLPDDHICVQFVNTYIREYNFSIERNGGKFVESYKEALTTQLMQTIFCGGEFVIPPELSGSSHSLYPKGRNGCWKEIWRPLVSLQPMQDTSWNYFQGTE